LTNKQVLLNRFRQIEDERIQLKQSWLSLKEAKGESDIIRTIGRRLTFLTFNQARILIDLPWEE